MPAGTEVPVRFVPGHPQTADRESGPYPATVGGILVLVPGLALLVAGATG